MPKFYDINLEDNPEETNELTKNSRVFPERRDSKNTEADMIPDLEQSPPSLEVGVSDQMDGVGVYGISIRGKSHIAMDKCCQDYNSFRYLPKEKIWILAIADGVGSCTYSHWGAYTAVNEAIGSLQAYLENESQAKKEPKALNDYTSEEIETAFHEAFSSAQKKVEDFADAHGQSVFHFQSTLTVALYDGKLLYCCHVGDDGIVAEGISGKYLMVTDRIKGEEANSVFTLQSGRWTVRKVNNVVAFVMSTDGILDSYVGNAFTNNRVYYPFFQKLTYSMQAAEDQTQREAVAIACDSAIALLRQKAVENVTDDMTVLVAANQALLERDTKPEFSQKAWDDETEALKKKQKEALYKYSKQNIAKAADNRPPIKPASQHLPPSKTPPVDYAKADRLQYSRHSSTPQYSETSESTEYTFKKPEYSYRKPEYSSKKPGGGKYAQTGHSNRQRSQSPDQNHRPKRMPDQEQHWDSTIYLENPDESFVSSLLKIGETISGFFEGGKQQRLLCRHCRKAFDPQLRYVRCPYCGKPLTREEEL